MGVGDNDEQGKAWETAFENQCRLQGLLVLKCPISAQHTWNGRLKPVKGPLDWQVADRSGVVAFLDTKSVSRDRFVFSDIEPHQIERAALYNEWRIPSGFVVYWAAINQVVFYSGAQLLASGPRTSFKPADGLPLGGIESFDVRLALKRPRARRMRLRLV